MTGQSPIYILGFGAIGSLLGVHLQKYGGRKVIPIFRSLDRLNEFKKLDCKITIKPLFDASLSPLTEQFQSATCPGIFQGKIDNLIVTCKTYQTAEALKMFLPYLHNDTNIIMIQNGLGVAEVLKEQVFTGSDLQSNLFQGVIGHGIFQDKEIKNQYNHAGFVDCKVSKLPENDENIIETLDQLNEWKQNDLVKASFANIGPIVGCHPYDVPGTFVGTIREVPSQLLYQLCHFNYRLHEWRISQLFRTNLHFDHRRGSSCIPNRI